MAVSATGSTGKMVENLRTLVAASTTFQTWTESDDAAEALGSIHCFGAAPSASRPFSLVSLGENERWQRAGIGVGDAWGPDPNPASLYLYFCGTVSATHEGNFEDTVFTFLNFVEGILEDIRGASGAAGSLAIQAITRSRGPEIAKNEDNANRGSQDIEVAYEVEVGA